MIAIKPGQVAADYYWKLSACQVQIAKGFEPEAIHHFRVTFKRLRALYRMCSFRQTGIERVGISKKLKKIYRLLGNIRDLQLQQERIAQYQYKAPGRKKVFLALQLIINKNKTAFLSYRTHHIIITDKKKSVPLLPGTLTGPSFRSYAAQQWAAIEVIIKTGEFSDEQLHIIRKHLKDLSCNAGLFNNTLNNESLQLQKKDIELLIAELGKFQDLYRAIEISVHYRAQMPPGIL